MLLSQMLDLPVEERRPYLHALPLTRVFVTGCLETPAIKHIRRLITRHGGVYRECYRYPGVFWVMTFRKHGQMLACMRAIARWERQMVIAVAEFLVVGDECLLTYESFTNHHDAPALRFEIDVDLPHKCEVRRPTHPIRG